jgi:hypothetical protein
LGTRAVRADAALGTGERRSSPFLAHLSPADIAASVEAHVMVDREPYRAADSKK